MGRNHLTATERESILCLRAQGYGIRKIAGTLNRSPSTISRELRRNLVKGAYSAHEADKLYRLRRKRCRPTFKLEDKELQALLRARLEEGWSPEQIKGRESLEVSVNTIYRAVKSGRLSFEARKHLRRRGKPYKKKTRQDGRGHIKDAVSIELRPKEVEQRLEIGNWEIDTVLGKPGTGGLVTVVDRKTRLLLAAKIEDKTATTVQAALIRLLEGMECRSLTTDNGKEFARHKEVSAALGVPVYFAHPHSPWERGTNENTNGLIREYLPKGIDFREVRSDDVLRIVEHLNNRPRKCLGFRTPNEAFFNLPVPQPAGKKTAPCRDCL